MDGNEWARPAIASQIMISPNFGTLSVAATHLLSCLQSPRKQVSPQPLHPWCGMATCHKQCLYVNLWAIVSQQDSEHHGHGLDIANILCEYILLDSLTHMIPIWSGCFIPSLHNRNAMPKRPSWRTAANEVQIHPTSGLILSNIKNPRWVHA